jgi:hypothetical protein
MTHLPRPFYIAYRVLEMLAQTFSRFVNAAFFGGSTRQTVSARAYAEQWPRGLDRINAVFRLFGVKNHCASAWEAEVKDAVSTLERNKAIEDKGAPFGGHL